MKTWIRAVSAAAGVAAVMSLGLTAASAGPSPAAAPALALAKAAAAPLITVQESVYVAIQPCRLIDTRETGGAFANAQVRSYNVVSANLTAQGGNPAGCGIPSTATAIAANLTAQRPGGNGYMRAWPASLTEPTATLLNYIKNQNSGSGVIVSIDPDSSPALKIKNYNGPAGLVVDVTGYFAPQLVVDIGALGEILGGGTGILDITNPSAGTYLIETDVDVTNCVPLASASPAGGLLGGLLGQVADAVVVDANHIRVQVAQIGLGGLLTLINAPVTLTVSC